MIPNRLSCRLLRLLLNSRQNDEIIDFMDLCEAAASRPYAVLKALQSLGSAGLVEPARLRLTFEGLAVASALRGPSAPAPSGPTGRPQSSRYPALSLAPSGSPACSTPIAASPTLVRCAA